MMKKLRSTLAASLSVLLLSACGFTPLHQSQSSFVGQSYANLRIESLDGKNPDDKEAGFDIKQRLIDRIGQGSGAHILEINPSLRQRRLGITDNDIASRFEITLNARYKILDAKTNKTLDNGRLTSVTSFGAPDDPFGRISAEEDAAERVSVDIADKLVIHLAKYYSKQAHEANR